MKTKKTYKASKAVLLISLLNLHTLSSCVHTAQKLGSDPYSNMNTLERKEFIPREELVKKKNLAQNRILQTKRNMECQVKPTLWYKSKKCITSIVGCGVALSVAGTGLYYYLLQPSETNPLEDPMALRVGNATTALATVEPELLNSVNRTVGSFIGNMTTTAATVLATLPTTAGLIAALKPSRSNVNYNSNSVTAVPDLATNSDLSMPTNCKLLNIEHPFKLSQEVIDNLKKNDFSIGSIECNLNQGLNVDARDKETRTMLMEVINSIKYRLNRMKIVKYLVEEKNANVNAQDDRGNTALGYEIFNARKAQSNNDANTEAKAKEGIDYLLEKGSDPCIKNIIGKPSKSDIESLNNLKLSDKFKKC